MLIDIKTNKSDQIHLLYLPHFPLTSVLQFQFVNSYLSLFYIGFYLKDMERLKEVRESSNSVPRQIETISEKMLYQLYE